MISELSYKPRCSRYENMLYKRCGRSGLMLPQASLGMWQNFGSADSFDNARSMIFKAFDSGITHFDSANAYGTPRGSAEDIFGKILSADLKAYRDEIVISTKAGFRYGEGPYREWGSKKFMISCLETSLKKMGIDYVDIYYSHRYDPNTPLEETMGAISQLVREGKVLYAGISNYSPDEAKEAIRILKSYGTPCIIYQCMNSILDRHSYAADLKKLLPEEGVGVISYSPLSRGLLSDRYLNGIPADSRAAKSLGNLTTEAVTPQIMEKISKLNLIAQKREQTLAQMAISWAMQDDYICSVILGASNPNQLEENLKAMSNTTFTKEELFEIDDIAMAGTR